MFENKTKMLSRIDISINSNGLINLKDL